MAFQDCFEVCLVALVLGRNYVWCLFIVAIFMRFGQAGAKRCKVINCKWRKSQKGDSFHREGRLSLCNTAILWNFIASLTGRILLLILLDTSLLYNTIAFEAGKAKSATQSVLIILTPNGQFQKNFKVFYFTPWNFQTKQGFPPRNST